MRTDVWIYNIIMYLYNKNILKYVEIVGSKPKSMILNTEGRSTKYLCYRCDRVHIFTKIVFGQTLSEPIKHLSVWAIIKRTNHNHPHFYMVILGQYIFLTRYLRDTFDQIFESQKRIVFCAYIVYNFWYKTILFWGNDFVITFSDP